MKKTYTIMMQGPHRHMAVECAQCEVTEEVFFHTLAAVCAGKKCTVSEDVSEDGRRVRTWFCFKGGITFLMEAEEEE